MANDSKKFDHLHAILFREAKIIISKYEAYLQSKITSKELAHGMLALRDAIKRIEESK